MYTYCLKIISTDTFCRKLLLWWFPLKREHVLTPGDSSAPSYFVMLILQTKDIVNDIQMKQSSLSFLSLPRNRSSKKNTVLWRTSLELCDISLSPVPVRTHSSLPKAISICSSPKSHVSFPVLRVQSCINCYILQDCLDLPPFFPKTYILKSSNVHTSSIHLSDDTVVHGHYWKAENNFPSLPYSRKKETEPFRNGEIKRGNNTRSPGEQHKKRGEGRVESNNIPDIEDRDLSVCYARARWDVASQLQFSRHLSNRMGLSNDTESYVLLIWMQWAKEEDLVLRNEAPHLWRWSRQFKCNWLGVSYTA